MSTGRRRPRKAGKERDYGSQKRKGDGKKRSNAGNRKKKLDFEKKRKPKPSWRGSGNKRPVVNNQDRNSKAST